MTIHIIHGIHSTQKYESIARLILPFQYAGAHVKYHNYGYASVWTARWKNQGRAEKILPWIKPGDICIGHSNGCTLIWMLAHMGAPMHGAVLINPALDDDAEFPAQLQWIDVYHNHEDTAVWFSDWFGLKDLIPHPWGKMGQVGYTGRDQRVTNIDTIDQTTSFRPPARGHSAIFSDTHIGSWAPYIVERTLSRDFSKT